jgi:hypothetical protein
MVSRVVIRSALLVFAVVLMSGCETVRKTLEDIAVPEPAAEPQVVEAAAPNWVRATGYAPISLQPGATPEHKMILAMRASKLRAYQELAAVVHGQYLFGTTAVRDMVLQDDQFKAAVSGIVRGARVVKSYPVQDDIYATILEVDINQLQRAWVSAQQ